MKLFAPINAPIIDERGLVAREWAVFFNKVATVAQILRPDGTIEPVSLADADAQDNSVYYSTDQSKLVYKDSSSVVNDLY